MSAKPSPSDAAPPSIDALGHGASDKRIDILRGIALTGSISQAAREAGVSYKAAWQAIDTLTNLAGVKLVERAVGGTGGGGASLTAQGMRLLDLAQAFEVARREVHARWTREGRSEGDGKDSDVRQDKTDDAGATLSRLTVRTSMRNQLPATVESLVATGRIVRVVMRLHGENGGDGANGEGEGRDERSVGSISSARIADRVAARITRESAELLGLCPGLPVIALCKATAVRVERTSALAHGNESEAVNRVRGIVASTARGEGGDELAIVLGCGLQLIGFAAGGTGLRKSQRVTAAIDESAMVVALAG